MSTAALPGPHPAITLPDRLSLILDALCRVVADHAGRHRAAAPLVLLLWPYLRRLAARFARAHARWRAGVSPRTASPRATRTVKTDYRRLPRGFAWLLRAAPQILPHTASLAGQLRALLSEAEMAAFLAASPQAGRLLRPLCRMLGHAPAEMPPAQHAPPPCCPPPPAEMPLPETAALTAPLVQNAHA